MAWNPEKSPFDVNSGENPLDGKKEVASARISLPDTSTNSTSSDEFQEPSQLETEQVETFNSVNTAARYAKLIEFGVSPMKAVLIAATEYAPVAKGEFGTDEFTATLNLNFGEEQSLSITNVVRLIELHRQIREYITDLTSQVLGKAIGLTSDVVKILFYLFRSIRYPYGEGLTDSQYDSDVVFFFTQYVSESSPMSLFPTATSVSDVSLIVDSLVERLKTLQSLTIPAESEEEEVDAAPLTEEEISQNQRMQEILNAYNTLKSFVTNQDNTLLRTVLEQIVYTRIVDETIDYLSGFLGIKTSLSQFYDVKKQQTRITDINAFAPSNTSFGRFIERFKGSGVNYESLGMEADPYAAYGVTDPDRQVSNEDILNNVLSFDMSALGDVESLLNLIISLANTILLNDTMSYGRQYANESTVDSGEAFNGLYGDLRQIMGKNLSLFQFDTIFSSAFRTPGNLAAYSNIKRSRKDCKQ